MFENVVNFIVSIYFVVVSTRLNAVLMMCNLTEADIQRRLWSINIIRCKYNLVTIVSIYIFLMDENLHKMPVFHSYPHVLYRVLFVVAHVLYI